MWDLLRTFEDGPRRSGVRLIDMCPTRRSCGRLGRARDTHAPPRGPRDAEPRAPRPEDLPPRARPTPRRPRDRPALSGSSGAQGAADTLVNNEK